MENRYMKAYISGRPLHEEYDSFWMKHPFMPSGRKAKIFAPFDALKGYDDCIASKEVLYEPMREPADQDSINIRLNTLHTLTYNSRIARINKPVVSVTYYVPCTDPNSSAYGIMGRYVTVKGICRQVSLDIVQVDEQKISIPCILSLSGDVFERCDMS